MRAQTLDAIAEPTARDFERFRELIQQHAGIHLNPSKKALLHGRLMKRIRELGLGSFDAYYRHVTDHEEEVVAMLDRITTNETHFFREPNHFAYLVDVLLPRWREAAERGLRGKQVKVWSAGCSTGEEPYSLAMTLLTELPQWSVDIFASDLSTRVLDIAREATWPIEKAREVPEGYLKRFMLKGTGAQSGKLRAGRELREVVRFDRVNLNGESYPSTSELDLIFCRNVLIYFDPARKMRVVERLAAKLAPTGHIFVGHAESIQAMSGRLRCVSPTIYALPAPARKAGAR